VGVEVRARVELFEQRGQDGRAAIVHGLLALLVGLPLGQVAVQLRHVALARHVVGDEAVKQEVRERFLVRRVGGEEARLGETT